NVTRDWASGSGDGRVHRTRTMQGSANEADRAPDAGLDERSGRCPSLAPQLVRPDAAATERRTPYRACVVGSGFTYLGRGLRAGRLGIRWPIAYIGLQHIVFELLGRHNGLRHV